MKKHITTIAIALLVSAFAVSNVNANDVKKPELYTRPLAVGTYQVGNFLKINLLVEKRLGERATVKLLDANKQVLYTETIAKNEATFKVTLDMSDLPSGTYFVETTTGNEKITKEVERGSSTLSY